MLPLTVLNTRSALRFVAPISAVIEPLTVLASGATDNLGAFSILVPDSQTRDVQVRILTRGDETPDLYLEVSTAAFVEYAVASPVASSHAPNTDLDFGTLVAEIGLGGEAFNCWDTGLRGTDYVAFLDGSRGGRNAIDLIQMIFNNTQ